MVEQPVTEPTLVCAPSRRDQRQACPENLQGPRNPIHKISTEPVAPADWRKKPPAPEIGSLSLYEKPYFINMLAIKSTN